MRMSFVNWFEISSRTYTTMTIAFTVKCNRNPNNTKLVYAEKFKHKILVVIVIVKRLFLRHCNTRRTWERLGLCIIILIKM